MRTPSEAYTPRGKYIPPKDASPPPADEKEIESARRRREYGRHAMKMNRMRMNSKSEIQKRRERQKQREMLEAQKRDSERSRRQALERLEYTRQQQLMKSKKICRTPEQLEREYKAETLENLKKWREIRSKRYTSYLPRKRTPESTSIRSSEDLLEKIMDEHEKILDGEVVDRNEIQEQLEIEQKMDNEGGNDGPYEQDTNHHATIYAPSSSMRFNILDEILSTERDYVENLRQAMDVIAKPCREMGVLSEISWKRVFGGLDSILNCNSLFLEELESFYRSNFVQNEEEDTKYDLGGSLAAIFLRHAPFFKIYSAYVNEYEERLVTLQNESRTNKGFQQFRSDTQVMLKDMGAKQTELSSFLILPVQRLPRYNLLLRDLLKHTTEAHPDKEVLKLALNTIEEVTQSVNSSKREIENMQQLFRLAQDLGVENLIQPHRTYIKGGKIERKKKGQSRPKSAHLYLFNDLILIQRTGAIRSMMQQIPLRNGLGEINVQVKVNNSMDDDSLNENGLSFNLVSLLEGEQTIYCADLNERNEWIEKISQALDMVKSWSDFSVPLVYDIDMESVQISAQESECDSTRAVHEDGHE